MKLLTRDKSFYTTLVRLAIPIALQSFISYAVNFADNLMIGRLGEYAVSGVYMGNQIQSILQFTMLGVTGSLVIMGAQYWGKKDTDSICRLTGLATKIGLIFALILTAAALFVTGPVLRIFTPDPMVIQEGRIYLRIVCFSYIFFCISQMMMSAMQCVENVRIGLYLSLITLVTNVSLNYILIFGKLGLPAMGIRGAALATVISRIVEAAVMLYYVRKIDKKMGFRFSDFFRPGGDLLKDLIRYGAPVLGGQVVWGINNLAQSAIIGRLSAEAIAAVSIAGNLNMLVFMIVVGFSAALGIITGKTVGAGLYETMKEYAVTAQILFVGIGCVLAGLIMILKTPYLSLYAMEPETIAIANQFLIILAITMVGRCYQGTCMGGLVKAGGDTNFIFRMDVIFVFLTVLPSALIALYVFHAPAWVVFACLHSDQITKCFVAVVKINRYNWMKNLTRENASSVNS